MEKSYNVSLDLRTSGTLADKIIFTSGDENSLRLRISLVDSKTPYKIPSGASAILNLKHPNYPGIEVQGTIADAANGVVEYTFSGGEFAMYGAHTARVIIKTETERLTWQQSFTITVEQGPQKAVPAQATGIPVLTMAELDQYKKPGIVILNDFDRPDCLGIVPVSVLRRDFTTYKTTIQTINYTDEVFSRNWNDDQTGYSEWKIIEYVIAD